MKLKKPVSVLLICLAGWGFTGLALSWPVFAVSQTVLRLFKVVRPAQFTEAEVGDLIDTVHAINHRAFKDALLYGPGVRRRRSLAIEKLFLASFATNWNVTDYRTWMSRALSEDPVDDEYILRWVHQAKDPRLNTHAPPELIGTVPGANALQPIFDKIAAADLKAARDHQAFENLQVQLKSDVAHAQQTGRVTPEEKARLRADTAALKHLTAVVDADYKAKADLVKQLTEASKQEKE